MAGVNSLKLISVRSHKTADIQFVPSMNAVVGPNGSGKTTVLESLYLLMRGSSFRGGISEVLSYGSDQMKLSAEFNYDNKSYSRSLTYRQSVESPVKKWLLGSKQHVRLPLGNRFPVVLFEPDLGRLITGSPARRRQYLDAIAGQLNLEVAIAQNRFERALRQRNQLLKQSGGKFDHELFVWNTQLAHLSEQVITGRLQVIEKLQKQISTYYQQLGGSDRVMLSYQSTVSTDVNKYASRLLHFLEASVHRDRILGHTSYGPHRDDLEFRLADQPAEERASRGEIRSVVIACKLLEAEILSEHFKNQKMKPILLLDDVLSELDLVHQERVLAGFKDYQVVLTTTDAHTLTPGTHTIAL